MTSMPENKTTKEPPKRTPVATATSVDTEAGTVTLQAGYEQFKTYEDTGWTAPRAIVTATVESGGMNSKTYQFAGPEASALGQALMIAASQATTATEASA